MAEGERGHVQGSTSKAEHSEQMMHMYASVKSGLLTSQLSVNSKS